MTEQPTETTWLTREQLCARWEIGKDALRALEADGLPRVKMGRVRFPWPEVDQWLRERATGRVDVTPRRHPTASPRLDSPAPGVVVPYDPRNKRLKLRT